MSTVRTDRYKPDVKEETIKKTYKGNRFLTKQPIAKPFEITRNISIMYRTLFKDTRNYRIHTQFI